MNLQEFVKTLVSPHATFYKGNLGFRPQRHGFCRLPEWIPGPICPRIPDFNGIPESESSVPDFKDKGSKFNNLRSWEFWNPYYLKLGDHHIILRSFVCILHS